MNSNVALQASTGAGKDNHVTKSQAQQNETENVSQDHGHILKPCQMLVLTYLFEKQFQPPSTIYWNLDTIPCNEDRLKGFSALSLRIGFQLGWGNGNSKYKLTQS